jgi:tetratricopeptide (TPR) repeat protein
MNGFSAQDQHHLDAAEGWLGLGDYLAANEEMELISPELRACLEVLLLRLQIYWRAKQWEVCVELAGAVVKAAPDLPDGWIGRSFALHELKRTGEAYDLLLPAKEMFPQNHTIPYNLACYCAQLTRLDEAEIWLMRAMKFDEDAVRRNAIGDPDLKPLWDRMSDVLWRRK